MCKHAKDSRLVLLARYVCINQCWHAGLCYSLRANYLLMAATVALTLPCILEDKRS